MFLGLGHLFMTPSQAFPADPKTAPKAGKKAVRVVNISFTESQPQRNDESQKEIIVTMTFHPAVEPQTNKDGVITDIKAPFKLNWPDSHLFWSDEGRTLKLATGLDYGQFFKLLNEKPLALKWDSGFGPVAATGDIRTRGGFSELSVRTAGGVTKIQPASPKVLVSASRHQQTRDKDKTDVILTFTFNQPVSAAEPGGMADFLKEVKAAEASLPLFLDSDLSWMSRWLNPQTLVFKLADLTEEDFEKNISDRVFKFKFNRNYVTPLGRRAVTLAGQVYSDTSLNNVLLVGDRRGNYEKINDQNFYFDRFKVLDLHPYGFSDSGRVVWELVFNKPVDKENLEKALSIEKLVRGDESAHEKTDYSFELKGPRSMVAWLSISAKHSDVLDVKLSNLASADGLGRISLYENRSTVTNQFYIRSSPRLERGENYPWEPYFDIDINDNVSDKNLASFIRLEPPLPFTCELADGRSTIRISAPFSRAVSTKIILSPGLRSDNGILSEKIELAAQFEGPPQSRLTFTGQGRYLSPKMPLYVKIAGREADFVRLQAWRIYENNLAPLLNVSTIVRSGQKPQIGLQMAKSLIDEEIPVAEGDRSFERLLDLEKVLGRQTGAYVLKVTPVVVDDKNRKVSYNGSYLNDEYKSPYYDYGDYTSHGERYLPIVITDLGLMARAYPESIRVWVTSLAAAENVAGAKIKLYDQASQVIFEGQTGSDGQLNCPADYKKVSFVSAELNGDLTYLRLAENAKENYDRTYNSHWQENYREKWFDGSAGYIEEDRGEGGQFLTKGYEGFMFLPRDMWKPGETLSVKAIIRDKNMLPPRQKFPLMWQVSDPDQRVIDEGRAEVSLNGSMDFSSELPFSARTGPGLIKLFIPGESQPIAQTMFTVDDFVPPRLKLTMNSGQEEYAGLQPEVKITGQANYLFDSPGAELNWEMKGMVYHDSFRSPAFPDFDFYGPETARQYGGSPFLDREGTLNEKGLMELTFEPNFDLSGLANLNSLRLYWAVQADSGRFEGQSISIPWYPRPVILGFKAPSSIEVNKAAEYQIAAVKKDGKPAEIEPVQVTISKVTRRYYTEVRYGRFFRQWTEEVTQISESSVSLKDGLGTVPLNLAEAGTYQIGLQLSGGDEVITRRFVVEGLTQAAPKSEGESEQMQLSLDRAFYRPGQEAVLQIDAPFAGRLWLTLESDRLLWSSVLAAEKGVQTIPVKVPAELITNAQLTATLVRPLEAKTTVFMTQARISMEKDRTMGELNIKTDLPERLEPKTKVPVKISLTDYEGKPTSGEATVTLVDEGILSMTGYRIKNPLRLFGLSRQLISYLFDMHDQLLPVEEKIWPFLAPGGGDESGLFSPFQRRRELLSIFEATVLIDEKGQGEVVLDLPEYSGRGRLTVVAADRDRFGVLHTSAAISRPLTVEPSIPLALAPGDSFWANILVFLAKDSPEGQAKVSLNFLGPLSLLEAPGFTGNQMTLELKPGQSRVLKVRLKAAPAGSGTPAAGPAELVVSGAMAGKTFETAATTVVRPPFPRVSRISNGFLTGPSEDLSLPAQGFLDGTLAGSLSLAAGPWVSANRAANYLEEYPYGCLEQTVSRAWYFLAGPALGRGGAAETANSKAGLITAAKRLATMQNYQGGLAYWPGQQDVYEWGTVYAAHFLTEAKDQIDLPQGLLEDILTYLHNYLASSYSREESVDYVLATKAYALYVLALNGDYQTGWINSLKPRAQKMMPSGAIFLAGAEALKDGHPGALTELDKNLSDLKSSTLRFSRSSLESGSRNSALLLQVWSNVDPLSARALELARSVADQGSKGLWTNTQENAQALWALTNYMKKTGSQNPYEVSLTGRGGRSLGTATDKDMATIKGPEFLASLEGPVKANVTGQGRPYYMAVISGVPTEAPEPLAAGISVAKKWILPSGMAVNLTDPMDPPELVIKRGQKIQVTLSVKSETDLQNVVVAELNPGGLEIAGVDESNRARPEIREDRLIMILPFLPADQAYKLSYELRAVTEGEYVLPPTSVEGMYQPDKKAILPTWKVSVVTAETDGQTEPQDGSSGGSED
jgi:uncharacterized protein YfaS (alpha-2-macroglobulin family)